MSISSSSYSGGFLTSEPSNSMVASSSSSGSVMPTLPLGMKMAFIPTDSLLIRFILHDSAPNFIITDCDLFGQEEPWEIWDRYLGFLNQYNPDELYFFMPSLKKLSPNGGSRINRTIGGGSWTQKEPIKFVCDDEDEGRSIGVKRKLRYHNQGSDQHVQWCLDEYTSVEVANSCAIFRLRKNERQYKSLCGICVEDFIQPLPLGMKILFRPTDSQLIRYFLGFDIAPDFIVYDCDLFGQEEPWEIWDRYSVVFNNSDLLYFFTSSMKKLGSKGRVCNFGRRVGSGTWNQKEAAKLVYDDEGEADQERKPIGRKRKLRYVNQGSVHHGEWYLEEYTSLVDEGAILLLRKNEQYKAPASSMSSGIPSEKKRKHREIDRLEEKKPRKKKASTRQLVMQDSDLLNRQSQTTTSPTVPIQQREPGNGDDNFVFFKGIDIGTWEFPSLDDFVMACPPPLTECDHEALATLEFPSLDEFVMACSPPLTDCDQEALATLEFPSPDDLASPSPPLEDCDQQVIAAVNIDDNHDLTGSCNDDDIATWSFPIVDYSLTSLLQGKCDEQALALVNSDDDLHFVKEDTGAWCPAFVDDFLMALLVDCDEQA